MGTSVDDARVSVDDAAGHSADDHTSGDDADDVDDHISADDVSADDGVVRPIGAPSVDDTSVDDSTASADDADDGIPNAVVVVQGITDMVNDLIGNNYGTPPPTPAPTVKEVDEGNAIDDVVNTITDAIGDIMNP